LATDVPAAFFSYCREDSEFALRLAEDLKAAGASVWIDQVDIELGTQWDRAVEDALNSCRRMLVILSPVSVKSSNVRDEVSFALSKQKRVIPVLFRECDVPFRLARLQHIDFRSDYERGLKSLLKALSMDQPARPIAPAPPEPLAKTQPHVSDAEERKRGAEQERLEEERKQAAERVRLEQQSQQAVQQTQVEHEHRQPFGSMSVRIGWLKRNWKWALPTWLALFFSIVGLVFYLIGNSEVSKLAFAQARSNASVLQRLGEPVERGWVIEGNVVTSGASGHADLAIPVSGPKGKGTLYVVTTKSAGQWIFETLQLKVEGDNERIDLLQSNPQAFPTEPKSAGSAGQTPLQQIMPKDGAKGGAESDAHRSPETVTVRHILIKTPPPGTGGEIDQAGVDAARKRAEAILRQLKAGASFADLAKRYSEDPGSAPNGGWLGAITKGLTVPEFEQAAFNTPVGQTTNLVRTMYGFHIILVEARQESH
jgi:parvulin-like peptidyl-prolyl isomerase